MKARFRCTGPVRASSTDLDASERHDQAASARGTPGSTYVRTAPPYRFVWSTVCGAPTPWSSGGRSVVTTSIGTPARSASTTDGCSSTAAVPLVVTTTAGRRLARPSPRAMKPAERSSTCTCTWMLGARARASAIGVDRDPGAITASVTPARAHSSTSVAQKVACAVGSSTGGQPTVGAHEQPAPGPGPRVHAEQALLGAVPRPAGRPAGAEAGRPGRARRRAAGPGPARGGVPAGTRRRLGRLPRLLAGRPGRPPPGARPARAGDRPRAHRRPPRPGGPRPSGTPGPRPTTSWPPAWSRSACPRSSTSGWPSRCSPRCRRRPTSGRSA